jgi:hypothetical protein
MNMEALIALFFVAFFGFVILCWYLIARAAGKVIKGAVDIADSAIQRRQAQGATQVPRQSVSATGSVSHGQFDFQALRRRQPKPGNVPGTQVWMDLVYKVGGLQSATKAVYYYSIGLYSSQETLLGNLTVESCHDASLYELLMKLKRSAQGRQDKPGAGQQRALTAGDSSQAPYSSVLWAVENGHYDQQVIEGLKQLVRLHIN